MASRCLGGSLPTSWGLHLKACSFPSSFYKSRSFGIGVATLCTQRQEVQVNSNSDLWVVGILILSWKCLLLIGFTKELQMFLGFTITRQPRSFYPSSAVARARVWPVCKSLLTSACLAWRRMARAGALPLSGAVRYEGQWPLLGWGRGNDFREAACSIGAPCTSRQYNHCTAPKTFEYKLYAIDKLSIA